MKPLMSVVKGALVVGALTVLAPIAAAPAASRPPVPEVEEYIKRSAVVGFEWVDQPVGRVLLLRGAQAVCAIRFLSYRQVNDARSPTAFDTGDASQFAAYEISELVINGSKVQAGAALRRELDYRGMRGLGRLAFTIGATDIECGRDRYPWSFPTGVGLRRDLRGLAIAPTNWQSFDEIRIDHPKLRWYEVDAQLQRPFVVIPLEDLPP